MQFTVPIKLTEDIIRHRTIKVSADLDFDGMYEKDISDDILSIDYINVDLENKSPGVVLGKPCASNAVITLINYDGKYSPNQENSPYFNKFKYNTKIKIEAGFYDGEEKKMQEQFQGVIVAFKGDVKSGEKVMKVTLHDFAAQAKKKDNPNHDYINGKYYEAVLFDTTISSAFNYLVDFCYGEDFPRQIDSIDIIHPVIEFPVGEKVWETMKKLAEAVDGKIYFEHGIFKFNTPHSPDYGLPIFSEYHFTTNKLFEFSESLDEKDIINKWKITSNAKTLQPTQVVIGTPSMDILSTVEYYKYDDGKNALGIDNKTITLKYQEDETWMDTINVPLVQTFTYSDWPDGYTPTSEEIDIMNQNSLVKVWGRTEDGIEQLTIEEIDYDAGKIILKDTINPNTYDLQISYQYHIDRILPGKYRWYEFELDNITKNIGEDGEKPNWDILVHDGENELIVGWESNQHISPYWNSLLEQWFSEAIVVPYISEWQVFDGNTKVKFKFTNSFPTSIYIASFNLYGNPLDCTNKLEVSSLVDDFDFVNYYEISNDYIVDTEFAKHVVDEYCYKYSRAKSFLQAKTKGIPQMTLLSRVTVTEESSGIDFDFIVIGYKHSINENEWETTLYLESLVPAWTYDEDRVEHGKIIYDPRSNLQLPVINITNNDPIEDMFVDETVKHAVTLHFPSPASLEIKDYLETKILRQELVKVEEGKYVWGRYLYCGSLTDPTNNNFRVTNLDSDSKYNFIVVVVNKYGAQSPYGEGYELDTPTTDELKATYSILPAPQNLRLVKAVNVEDGKANISVACNPCPVGYYHYKETVFEYVQKDLNWSHGSKESISLRTNSTIITLPDEQIYKFRVAYKDIWDRTGTWSEESTVSGGNISENDLNPDLLEVEISSSVDPASGTLDNLINGYDNEVTFNQQTTITYSYPIEHVFDSVRFKISSAVNFYVQYLDRDGSWVNVIGTPSIPATSVANIEADDANVFKFRLNGALDGTEIRRRARKMRITFLSGCTIANLLFWTFSYFDTLIVRDGEIKSAKIESLQADKIKIGGNSAPIPLAITQNDTLFRFDNSLYSTQGLRPLGME